MKTEKKYRNDRVPFQAGFTVVGFKRLISLLFIYFFFLSFKEGGHVPGETPVHLQLFLMWEKVCLDFWCTLYTAEIDRGTAVARQNSVLLVRKPINVMDVFRGLDEWADVYQRLMATNGSTEQ